MIDSRPWHPVSLLFLAFSLALHFFSVVLHLRLPDSFAAYTVFPIWVWGGFGLFLAVFSYLFFRGRFSLLVCLIWIITILIMSDEARTLGRITQPTLKAGKAEPHAGGRILRVASLNCAKRAKPSELAKPYQPDILFLQEIPHTYRLKKLIDDLYQGQGDYRYNARKGTAVVVHGKIEFEVPVPTYRAQILTVKMHTGESVQLMNVHLQGASTNLKLWEWDCWREHQQNRKRRQIEMAYLTGLLRQKTPYHRLPTIIAGDFNAPANDAVYRLLGNDFSDAFNAVGTGWGNTYHRSLPLLRIDHIFSSKMLIPLRSKTIPLESSDHKAVIVDYIYR
jgi:endonuclease/exonuclease/phosphatase family metal-dependent hydrolase